MPKKPDEITASLLARILHGEFRATMRLPREDDLALDYDVSKGTVREARKALEDRGVVCVKHGVAGAAIQPDLDWSLLDMPLLRALVESPAGGQILEEAIECRLLFEPEAAALATERADRQDLAALESAVARIDATTKTAPGSFPATDARAAAEADFMRAVLGAARNRFLARSLLPLGLVMIAASPSRAALRRTGEQHALLLDAIRSRDTERARETAHARVVTAAAAVQRRSSR
jgi:DNA-binding FadR family transcriptional regulator